jgi:hydrogenase maturation protease
MVASCLLSLVDNAFSLFYNKKMVIVACGVGQRDRGDDGFGPYVIEQLRGQKSIRKIDCGLYPENYLNKITALAPNLVIFFDTIMNDQESAVVLMNEEILERTPVSVTTHSLSFAAMYEFLRANGVSDIFFFGVPVLSYEVLSKETRDTADRIIAILNKVDKHPGFGIINLYEALSEQIR